MVQKSDVPSGPQPRTPRGRPRAYDPDVALDAAIAAFWRAGYTATSLDTLSEATGMNRPSLYGAFGDKHALYLAALKRYADQACAAMDVALDPSRPLRDGSSATSIAAQAWSA